MTYCILLLPYCSFLFFSPSEKRRIELDRLMLPSSVVFFFFFLRLSFIALFIRFRLTLFCIRPACISYQRLLFFVCHLCHEGFEDYGPRPKACTITKRRQ
ncbi:hypothetical protein BDW72DRAFT_64095 [Aspergillus terricola var. indicus]